MIDFVKVQYDFVKEMNKKGNVRNFVSFAKNGLWFGFKNGIYAIRVPEVYLWIDVSKFESKYFDITKIYNKGIDIIVDYAGTVYRDDKELVVFEDILSSGERFLFDPKLVKPFLSEVYSYGYINGLLKVYLKDCDQDAEPIALICGIKENKS